MKEHYQKVFKKLTLFFLSNPVHVNGKEYEKQKGPGISDELFFWLQDKFKKIPILVMYYLTTLITQYKAVFQLFQKLYLLI